ncbi:hypothetical protein ACLQ24_10115 [Micromonospora sp. DT4]|uniref:hypothetical protein n=1 Tax=Micromonospora sp. DT4 TaxID=3393438 RepID=UPI003CF5455D
MRERGHAMAAVSTAMAGLCDALGDRPDLVVPDLGAARPGRTRTAADTAAVSSVPVIVAAQAGGGRLELRSGAQGGAQVLLRLGPPPLRQA